VYVKEPQERIPRCVYCQGCSDEGIGLSSEDSGSRAYAREPRQLLPRCWYCTGLRAECLLCRVRGKVFSVQGSGLGVYCAGFRV